VAREITKVGSRRVELDFLKSGDSFMGDTDLVLKDRFAGCFLGLAIGDALGAKFETQSADAIRARFSSVEQLIAYPQEEIWYTDDTQMAIGVAEALVADAEVIEEHLCQAFVVNPRGTGRP
jgi:poly(ADP-ribose) glycohydrolase ARH3